MDNGVDGDEVVGVNGITNGGVVALALGGAVRKAAKGHVPRVVEGIGLVVHLLGGTANDRHAVLVEGSLGLVCVAHSHDAGQRYKGNNHVPHAEDSA